MLTISSALKATKKTLQAFPEAAMEAEVLLGWVLKQPRAYLHTWPDKSLSEIEEQQLQHYLARRLLGEPFAYLTGQKEFWSLMLQVTPDTLIPRPETELLVESVLALGPANGLFRIAELGTGSGAIAISLASERPHWTIYATDISEKALQIASNNAQQLGIANISFFQGSWCTAIPDKVDMIVSNPPYLAENEWEKFGKGLAYEPYHALVAGIEGIEAIRLLCQTAEDYLNPGGYLLIEHGYTQGEAVRRLFMEAGYTNIHTKLDLAGLDRMTLGQRLPKR